MMVGVLVSGQVKASNPRGIPICRNRPVNNYGPPRLVPPPEKDVPAGSENF